MSPPSAIIDDQSGSRSRSLHVAPGFWREDVVSVLLVEDDDVDAKLINLYAAGLTHPQVVIARAACASEARALLARQRFDLYILDFWLGCESSLRLLAELDDRETARPTIVLTGLSTPDVDLMCQRGGASLFIGKEGLGPASLQAAILSALRTAATRPQVDLRAARKHRSPMDGDRVAATPDAAFMPGFGLAETREGALVRGLSGMLGGSDATAGNGAASAAPQRGREGGRGPGRPRPSSTELRRDLLLDLLDMTETVRFGLFENVLMSRRPDAQSPAEDAGGFVASALAIARHAFDDRGQTVSFRQPDGAIALPCDPATFLFMTVELVLRASQQSMSKGHVGISLDVRDSALHISLVSDRPTHAHASAIAFGPLFLQLLGCCRGAVHAVSDEGGRLRVDCRLDAATSADAAGRASPAIMARNPSGWTPSGRAAHHHPPDAG